MKGSIEIVEPKLFAGAVADELSASLAEAIAERGTASVALAGGSTPGAIYRLLALPPRVNDIEWQKVHLFWGDERWVPHHDTQSNYRMVRETLLDNILSRSPKIYPIDVAAPSPEEAATRYAAQIRSALGTSGDGVPVLDIVILGIGQDGHTASLFPGSELLAGPCDIAAAVHRADGTSRITLTPPLLFSARRVLFIARGENKADIVRQVIEGHDTPQAIPARACESAADRVTWFIDSGAAKKLSQELIAEGRSSH